MNGIHPKERRKEGRSSTETPSLDGGMDGPEWTSPARMAGDGTAPDLTCMTGSQPSLPAIIRFILREHVMRLSPIRSAYSNAIT
mmetsp:Transcript_21237/g.29438  ORF Transcript_21237/g.29438 Transcript_21237/m.29438 type:complete len:84 (+) Transcript_21237:387-638(+)